MLPYAALWHIAFALWAFTVFRTSPDEHFPDGPASYQLVVVGVHFHAKGSSVGSVFAQ
jgi:hypothetical protein